MIREDRELLTELARLNREMTPLAMRMMDGSASVTEQQAYAERLIAAGERLQRRAEGKEQTVIEGAVLTSGALTLPVHTVEPHREA
ncbi:MAG: hypothetical protein M3Y48_21265 [Actinomycetota bacterium]|nr:hypothetical protein [Actinomycetota bacterium]